MGKNEQKGQEVMRRLLMIVIAAALIVPAAVSAKDPTPFSKFMKDRTTENFLEAFRHYENARADTADYGAAVVLAYMSLIELEKNLDILEENIGDLTKKNLFGYGNILLELGRYDEAIAIYDTLNQQSPKWSCPWRHKGEAMWKKGDLDDAVAALSKAIETRQSHYDAYVMLAEVYNDRGECEKALKTLEKGLTYYGKDVEDPEEEVSSLDVSFLHLELLKKCGDRADYDELFEKLSKIAPGDERLK